MDNVKMFPRHSGFVPASAGYRGLIASLFDSPPLKPHQEMLYRTYWQLVGVFKLRFGSDADHEAAIGIGEYLRECLRIRVKTWWDGGDICWKIAPEPEILEAKRKSHDT